MINLGEKMIYTIESRFNYNDREVHREVRSIIDNLCNVDYELDMVIYNPLRKFITIGRCRIDSVMRSDNRLDTVGVISMEVEILDIREEYIGVPINFKGITSLSGFNYDTDLKIYISI